jgi:hypothetical protein
VEAITMSKTVTLELTDEVYVAVEAAAAATGQPPGEWIVGNLCNWLPARVQPNPPEQGIDIDALLRKVAVDTCRPFEEVKAEWKAANAPQPRALLSDEDRRAARNRLLQYAGAVSSGDPHSGDNERIDADLAREYGNTHEDEA